MLLFSSGAAWHWPRARATVCDFVRRIDHHRAAPLKNKKQHGLVVDAKTGTPTGFENGLHP